MKWSRWPIRHRVLAVMLCLFNSPKEAAEKVLPCVQEDLTNALTIFDQARTSVMPAAMILWVTAWLLMPYIYHLYNNKQVKRKSDPFHHNGENRLWASAYD